MAVLVTCKFEEDPIKTEGAIDWTRSKMAFFSYSKASNSKVSELSNSKNPAGHYACPGCLQVNEDLIKTKCAINRTFSNNKCMGKFFVTQEQISEYSNLAQI